MVIPLRFVCYPRRNSTDTSENLNEISMAEQEEYLMYELQPSQLLNVGWFVLPFVYLFAFGFNLFILIPLFIAGYKYLEIATWTYQIYDDRIVEKKGIFDVRYEEMRYFRIKSIMSVEPFWMRIFGMGIIHVMSSEEFKPTFVFHGVYHREDIVNFLNEATHEWREKMGVKEYDLNNL
jgi:hypothetical protein